MCKEDSSCTVSVLMKVAVHENAMFTFSIEASIMATYVGYHKILLILFTLQQ